MNMTRQKAARLLSQRLGIGVEAAEAKIDRNDSQWQTFAAAQNIQIKTEQDAKVEVCALNAEDIDGSLKRAWSSIQQTQDRIDEALQEGSAKDANDFARALSALQKSYLDLAEIKIMDDNMRHNTVSKELVETIITDTFGDLKKALNDLAINIKQTLPKEQRATFDLAWNKHLPNYARHIQGTVKKLNELFES